MNDVDRERVIRAAKQMVEVDRLFGLRAVPRGAGKTLRTVDSSAGGIDVNESKMMKKSGDAALVVAEEDRDAVRAEKAERLAALCERHNLECPLVKTMPGYTNVVFGEGDPDARLMFVGEAPGAEEDATGRPFVGRSGQLLTKMITAMGVRREDVYIANILKVRPPNNATPTPEQVMQSAPYLAAQIEIIEPEVIVTLGAPSTKFVLDSKEGIGKLRGRWHKAAFAGLTIEIAVMPTFHPAYLLRSYTAENRKKVWSDLKAAMERLGIGVGDGGDGGGG